MPIPNNQSKLVRKSAKESAFSKIQEWIIDGTLLPGEKLNDLELAQALGVSRTPVREALQLLEFQGFVKMYPGKATQVTAVQKEAIRELLPPLAALQALAVELATPKITADQIKLLEKTNRRFADAIHAGNGFLALKIDEEYHDIIVGAANNPYITKTLGSLLAHVRRLFFHDSIILNDKSIQEHAAIIDSLKIGDHGTAANIMKINWLRAIEELQFKNE